MKHALALLAALLLGLAAGEYLTQTFVFRAWMGRLVRRGELVALVGTRGIYDRDLTRTGRSRESLIDELKLADATASQGVGALAVEREMNLLRWQFSDEKTWNAALEKAGLTSGSLRREVADNLRSRAWLETRLAAENSPNEKELRHFYEEQGERFQEPLRFRAAQLFLAAPDGYPPEVIEQKRALIEDLAARLDNGESFTTLVAEFSEDEATKTHDGDLNYFDEARMLPEIWSALQTLAEGATSGPIRSRLGFHLLRLTNRLPAQQLSFEQTAPEIAAALENEKRASAIPALVAQLPEKIQFATPGN